MDASRGSDLVAAARISRRVELREIRLTEIFASGPIKAVGSLQPQIDHDCVPIRHDANSIEVECSYRISVTLDDVEVVRGNLKYLISYSLSGEEPVSDEDLVHFAFANGTYHSWPFVRQTLFGLTSDMGYPPYTLPVFKFNPKPKPVEPETAVAASEDEDANSDAGELAEATE